MNWDTIWLLLHLAIHVIGVYVLIYLMRNAPDRTQVAVLTVVMLAFIIYVAGDLSALALGHDFSAAVYQFASRIEHLGVLVFVFRLLNVHEEKECRMPKSASSRPSYRLSRS